MQIYGKINWVFFISFHFNNFAMMVIQEAIIIETGMNITKFRSGVQYGIPEYVG